LVDIKRMIQAQERRAEVFADSDLPEHLKLFVLAGLHIWETAPDAVKIKTFTREHWAYRALRMMGYSGTAEELSPKLRYTILSQDVPKYRMSEDRSACIGTMLRPSGGPCTQKPTITTTIPNPLTGEREWFASCSRPIHRADFDAQHAAAWQAWRDNGEPKPKPNSGGLLLRYFGPRIEELYAWADNDYQRGDKVPEPPAQNLAIVTSLADRRPRKDT
jgi:hypothetical protein